MDIGDINAIAELQQAYNLGSSIKIPVHSRVAIVCTLKEYHEVGDHYLYICDVGQVYGDASEEALFAWNGYAQLRPAK